MGLVRGTAKCSNKPGFYQGNTVAGTMTQMVKTCATQQQLDHQAVNIS
jgi:hypothetical protein